MEYFFGALVIAFIAYGLYKVILHMRKPDTPLGPIGGGGGGGSDSPDDPKEVIKE